MPLNAKRSSIRQLHHNPPIHQHRLADDPRTVSASQELDRVGDLLGLAKPVKGAPSLDRVDQALRLALVEQLRGSWARSHSVDNDALCSQSLGHHSRHLLNGPLCCCVEEILGRHG